MLKNKFKIIALLMVIILALMVPIVHAEDNEADGQTTEDQAVINGAEEQANQNTINLENYKDGDVYLTGDEVTIDYIIDGNLFVFANTVNINSQIGGDAFIVANNITVNEGGYIFSNLFALAPNVTINGVVYDVYAYSNNLNINGYIYRDVRAIANTFNLSEAIRRNAYLRVDNLQFATNSDNESNVTSQGSIGGNLNYSAKQEISIPDGIVSGTTNYTQIVSSSASVQSYLLALGRFLVTVIVIWLLCLWLAPKFLNRTDLMLTKKLPSTIGLGILTPIVLIIASVILLLLGITSTVAGLGIIVLLVACAISSAIFAIAINNLICKKLNIEKSIGKLGILILTAAILWLIDLIPFVGRIVVYITAILGLGILLNGILPYNRNKDFSESKTEQPKTEKPKEDKKVEAKKSEKDTKSKSEKTVKDKKTKTEKTAKDTKSKKENK